MANQKLRVLVVDDFETVRLLFEKCLAELGITDVTQAEDGEAALRQIYAAHAEKRPFDILFVDWNMPNKNGYEVLTELREKENFQDIPFVMVTANSDETAVVDAIRAGVSEYVVKPFDTRTLARTIERLIRKFKIAV